MKSEILTTHFQLLATQREEFLHDIATMNDKLWERPLLEKWSMGETLCHLLLMVRLFRRFSRVYIPVMKNIARARRKSSFKIYSQNIYQEYSQKKHRAMEAPSLIKPKPEMIGIYDVTELMGMLQKETDKLRILVRRLEEEIAGNIYYVDPVAHHPNLIQSIHLLAIHEQHHYNLVKKYYDM